VLTLFFFRVKIVTSTGNSVDKPQIRRKKGWSNKKPQIKNQMSAC